MYEAKLIKYLEETKKLLERDGWTKTISYRKDANGNITGRCLSYAFADVVYRRQPFPALIFPSDFYIFGIENLVEYNDAEGRTKEDIIALIDSRIEYFKIYLTQTYPD